MDPDLIEHLEEINHSIEQVSRKMGGNTTSFFRGVLSGLGSVVGAALAVLLIGWFLNAIGIIPALRDQANQWKNLIQQTQQKASTNARQ